MTTKNLLVGTSMIALLALSGCIAGKVSQEDLSTQWQKLSGKNLQETFCNKTMSGFGDRAEWTAFWSSDCQTGYLEVGPSGKYFTEYRTVEVLNDKYCITPDESDKSNCYSLYQKDGKYLDIKTTGEQDTIKIKDGIPKRIQKKFDSFISK